MELGELLSALGTPARLGARILFIPRYLVHGFESLRRWRHNTYARTRFGATFVWRVWLLFDVAKLEALEVLLNEGSDEEVLNMRDTRLESFWTVALVVCISLLFCIWIQLKSMRRLLSDCVGCAPGFYSTTSAELAPTDRNLVRGARRVQRLAHAEPAGYILHVHPAARAERGA